MTRRTQRLSSGLKLPDEVDELDQIESAWLSHHRFDLEYVSSLACRVLSGCVIR